jgi:hypothetical protein
VPADLIDVKVADGWVTLTGDVSYQFESDAAFEDAVRDDLARKQRGPRARSPTRRTASCVLLLSPRRCR